MRDESFRLDVRAALERQSVPSADIAAILSRVPRRTMTAEHGYARIAIAALAIVLLLAVMVTPQTFANAVNAIRLAFMPPPKTLVHRLKAESKNVRSPEEAQALVRFHLAPPRGLPLDARLAGINAGPSGTWSAKTKQWTIGPTYATFTYRRNDGRIFRLQAEAYDASERQNAYIWDADTGKRFNRFAWRNGDQQMSAIADGISDAEVLHIERAMNGAPIAEVKTRGPHGGRKFFVVPFIIPQH